MKNKDTGDLVLVAMRNSQFRWRTARGVAKDTGIPIVEVVDFLERSVDVIRAKKANSQGQALYALREKSDEAPSFVDRLRNAALNKPGDES